MQAAVPRISPATCAPRVMTVAVVHHDAVVQVANDDCDNADDSAPKYNWMNVSACGNIDDADHTDADDGNCGRDHTSGVDKEDRGSDGDAEDDSGGGGDNATNIGIDGIGIYGDNGEVAMVNVPGIMPKVTMATMKVTLVTGMVTITNTMTMAVVGTPRTMMMVTNSYSSGDGGDDD